MNIGTIVPAMPQAAPNTVHGASNSDADNALEFADALAAELPDAPEGAANPATGAATTGIPGDVATSPAAVETPPQDAAIAGLALTPQPWSPDTGAAAPAFNAPLAVASPASTATPLQRGSSDNSKNFGALEMELAEGIAPRPGPATPTTSASRSALTLLTEKASPQENGAGSALADSLTADTGTGNAQPPLAAVTPGLALTPAAQLSAALPAALPRLEMSLPLQHRGWAAEFSQRVVLSIGAGLQAAELRLNPEELGPISVRVSMDGKEASVTFVALHPQVRSVIEQALPLLRESLQQSGLQLGEAAVSSGDQSQGEQRDGLATSAGAAQPRRPVAEVLPVIAAPAAYTAHTLLVDTYA